MAKDVSKIIDKAYTCPQCKKRRKKAVEVTPGNVMSTCCSIVLESSYGIK